MTAGIQAWSTKATGAKGAGTVEQHRTLTTRLYLMSAGIPQAGGSHTWLELREGEATPESLPAMPGPQGLRRRNLPQGGERVRGPKAPVAYTLQHQQAEGRNSPLMNRASSPALNKT